MVKRYSFVEGVKQIDTEKILFIESRLHKCYFHCPDGVYSIYRKLDEAEEDLKEEGFLRIHQSFLVNVRFVEDVRNYSLTMQGGEQFSVPKKRFRKIKEAFVLTKQNAVSYNETM